MDWLAKILILSSLVWLPTGPGLSVKAAAAANPVVRLSDGKLDLQVQQGDLLAVLRKLGTATGWEVFVEPDLKRTVSVRFQGATPAEGLKLLLGDLNFALVPLEKNRLKLVIFRSSARDATVRLAAEEAGRSRRIPNELIVSLRSGAGHDIQTVAERLGAKIIGESDGLGAYRLQFADEAAARAAEEFFAGEEGMSADPNFLLERPEIPELFQAGAAPPPFPLRPTVSTDGSQVVVGLIDTFVQPLAGARNAFMLDPLYISGEPRRDLAQPAHGTSMADTILQGLTATSQDSLSPVRILPVDVYGPHLETTTFEVGKGIYAAINGGATIINMSLGGDGESRFLADLIQSSHQQGVLFFGAAGNSPTTALTYPAAYPGVMAVTAVDRQGNLAPYANRGSFVDVAGPGASVIFYNGQSFFVSGTSASTAFVSGSAAGIKAGGAAPAQVEAQLRERLRVPPQAPKP